MGLPGRQGQAGGVAPCIDRDGDLGAQAAGIAFGAIVTDGIDGEHRALKKSLLERRRRLR